MALHRRFRRAERGRELIKWAIAIPVLTAIGAGVGVFIPGLEPFTKGLSEGTALSFHMTFGGALGFYLAVLGCASTRGI